MKHYAKIEKFITYPKVQYYTIRYEYTDGEEDEESETDKFLRKYLIEPEIPSESAQNIYNLIREIGKRSASSRYFRFENSANALPPKPKIVEELGFEKTGEPQLRLYCIRLSNSVVILLNGGIKTTYKAQHCPLVGGHFRMANKIAMLVDEAIQEDDICLNYKRLLLDEGFVLML